MKIYQSVIFFFCAFLLVGCVGSTLEKATGKALENAMTKFKDGILAGKNIEQLQDDLFRDLAKLREESSTEMRDLIDYTERRAEQLVATSTHMLAAEAKCSALEIREFTANEVTQLKNGLFPWFEKPVTTEARVCLVEPLTVKGSRIQNGEYEEIHWFGFNFIDREPYITIRVMDLKGNERGIIPNTYISQPNDSVMTLSLRGDENIIAWGGVRSGKYILKDGDRLLSSIHFRY